MWQRWRGVRGAGPALRKKKCSSAHTKPRTHKKMRKHADPHVLEAAMFNETGLSRLYTVYTVYYIPVLYYMYNI